MIQIQKEKKNIEIKVYTMLILDNNNISKSRV